MITRTLYFCFQELYKVSQVLGLSFFILPPHVTINIHLLSSALFSIIYKHSIPKMFARSIGFLSALALAAGATSAPYGNSTTAALETTIYTTVCPATSIMTSGTHTFTSTYATTSTITSCKGGCPTAPVILYCEKLRKDCQSKPDANQTYCASVYVNCTGTTSGLNYPPVPTSTAIPECDKDRSDCQSQPDANQAECAAKYVACAGTTSGLNKPTPSATGSLDCEKIRSDCQSQPDANQAVCAAKYVQCAGTTSGLNKEPAASTAAAQAPASTSKAASSLAGSTMAKSSQAVASTASGGSGAGSSPSTTVGISVTFTGAASAFEPAYVGLLGVAALVVLS